MDKKLKDWFSSPIGRWFNDTWNEVLATASASGFFVGECKCKACEKCRQQIGHKINIGRHRQCFCDACRRIVHQCERNIKQRANKKLVLASNQGKTFNIKIPGYFSGIKQSDLHCAGARMLNGLNGVV